MTLLLSEKMDNRIFRQIEQKSCTVSLIFSRQTVQLYLLQLVTH